MALNEIAMQNGCVPEWTLVSEAGPQHQKVSQIMYVCDMDMKDMVNFHFYFNLNELIVYEILNYHGVLI